MQKPLRQIVVHFNEPDGDYTVTETMRNGAPVLVGPTDRLEDVLEYLRGIERVRKWEQHGEEG